MRPMTEKRFLKRLILFANIDSPPLHTMVELSRRDFGKMATVAGIGAAALTSATLMEGCSASPWINTALNDLPVIINIADSILGIIIVATGNGSLSTSIGATITTISTTVKNELAALQGLINTYNANKQPGALNDVIDALSSLSTNLSAIIAALPVGVPTTITTAIATAVSLAVAVVSSIQLLIPSAVTPTPANLSVKVGTLAPLSKQVREGINNWKLPDTQNLRTMFNAVLVMQGFPGQQV